MSDIIKEQFEQFIRQHGTEWQKNNLGEIYPDGEYVCHAVMDCYRGYQAATSDAKALVVGLVEVIKEAKAPQGGAYGARWLDRKREALTKATAWLEGK